MKARSIRVLGSVVSWTLLLSQPAFTQAFDLTSKDASSKVAVGEFFKVGSEGVVSTFAAPEFSNPVFESSDSLYTIDGVHQHATGVQSGSKSAPTGFSLDQNFPNPFNPSTTIRYTVGTPSRISLVLYDLAGRVVRTLVNDETGAGTHAVQWDGRTDNGTVASTGVYVYHLLAAGSDGAVHSDSKKMVLMK